MNNKCAVCQRTFAIWSEYSAHISTPHRIYRRVDPEIIKTEVESIENYIREYIPGVLIEPTL